MAVPAVFPKACGVIAFLRFIGVMNAAIWFGAVLFFTVGVLPALTAPALTDLFGGARNPLAPAYAGLALELLLERYHPLNYVCGGVAAAHLLIEWLYSGKPARAFMVYLVLTLLALGLLHGLVLQPKLNELHRIRYGRGPTPEQRAKAAKMFQVLHRAAGIMNYALAAGLFFYTWRVAIPGESARPASPRKIRG